MLQLVRAIDRAAAPVSAKTKPQEGPQSEWLTLSAETALGYGKAIFLSEALSSPDQRRRAVLLVLLGSDTRPASLHLCRAADAIEQLAGLGTALALVCSATPAFLAKLGLTAQPGDNLAGYYVPPELKMLAQAGMFTRLTGQAAAVYRAAKGMELVCEALSLHAAGLCVPLSEHGELSMQDSERVLAAKNLIAERFREKLTLEAIARACGINRAKLTRGFRNMFNSTIAETIIDHKLTYASQLITVSDRSISSVGYAVGYANNASFARAFHRHFGVSPSEFRASARRRAGGVGDVMAAA
jgi:AraC family transcriptional activator of pyochelin receptor